MIWFRVPPGAPWWGFVPGDRRSEAEVAAEEARAAAERATPVEPTSVTFAPLPRDAAGRRP
jgi:hypothetical protein